MKHRWLGLLATIAFLAAGLWNLGGPPPWWDEGWTLSVARTWLEHGLYGRLRDGLPAPPGLNASFWVTAPVALGMHLFGVGIWQGRLFGVLCATGALALLYLLAQRLYTRRVAVGALAVVLLLSMHPQLHPLIMGRQVLGEMPMLLLLLAGFAALLPGLRPTRSALAWLPLAAIVWAFGIQSKAQALPFWALAIFVTLLVQLVRRRWRVVALLAATAAVTLALQPVLLQLQLALIAGHSLPPEPLRGLNEVVGAVFTGFNRGYALTNALSFGLPALAGLVWAARGRLRGAWATSDDALYTVWLALLALVAGWLGWFALLSVGVPRYLFPVTFIASIFLAALLDRLTSGFSLKATLARATLLRQPRQAASAWLAILIVATTLPLTLLSLTQDYLFANDHSAEAVAAFFNQQTPATTRIETYESELHFLLDRPYHYPPDQVHVELNRRGLLAQDVPVAYDPLASAPDYLVVGPFSRGNQLYAPQLAAGNFRPLQTIGTYQIYQRVR